MTISLSTFGRSFATRSRARAIIGELPEIGPFTLDLSDVFVSPAFMAEFLLALVERGAVEVVSDERSAFNLDMARTLRRQLKISFEVAEPFALA